VDIGSFSFLEFANKVMARIYCLFFDSKLPRVSKDMKVKLQLSIEPTGDWFLYRDFTVLRIYGFTDAPYKLPAFFTSRIFASEFIRQRLYVEGEHLLKHKKVCGIKFNYIVHLFVVKSFATLHVVEEILKGLKFEKDQRMNYDPRHIILKRKSSKRCGIFKHQEIEGLRALANLESFEEYCQVTEAGSRICSTQRVPLVVDSFSIGIQTPQKNDVVNKRPHEEVVEVKEEGQSCTKKARVSTKDNEIVNLEEEDAINQENQKGAITENEEEQQWDTCSSEHTISQTMSGDQEPQSVLQI
jgi:hypothetical protein